MFGIKTKTPPPKFTAEETSLLVQLVARLDPDDYASDKTKTVIFKCRSAITDGLVSFTVLDH